MQWPPTTWARAPDSDDSGGNPRLARLLKENAGLSPREVVELACAEMVRRWRAGRPTSVEAYLSLHAALSDDDEAVLDLIDCELALREERGEKATIDEYLQRFPTRAEGPASPVSVGTVRRYPCGREREGTPGPSVCPDQAHARIRAGARCPAELARDPGLLDRLRVGPRWHGYRVPRPPARAAAASWP